MKFKKISLSIRDGMAKRENCFELAPVAKELDEKSAAVIAAFEGDQNATQQE